MAFAAEIYLLSGYPDSAFIYAKELINSSNNNNRINGYLTILTSELINRLTVDTISSYVNAFHKIVDSMYNQNATEAALMQLSLYNYNVHQRERIKAEKAEHKMHYVINYIICIVFILIIIILYLRNRSKKQLLRLHEALDNIRMLREVLENNDTEDGSQTLNRATPQLSTDKKDALRECLRNEILSLLQGNAQPLGVSPTIIQSSAYSKLQTYIAKNKAISENNPLWDEIEETIAIDSKDFKYRLQLLTNGMLKKDEYHVAMLIKCGITPTQMTILIGRTKGTISYRRKSLSSKILDEKFGAKHIDDIISLL